MSDHERARASMCIIEVKLIYHLPVGPTPPVWVPSYWLEHHRFPPSFLMEQQEVPTPLCWTLIPSFLQAGTLGGLTRKNAGSISLSTGWDLFSTKSSMVPEAARITWCAFPMCFQSIWLLNLCYFCTSNTNLMVLLVWHAECQPNLSHRSHIININLKQPCLQFQKHP